MDHIQILTRAAHITWRHKSLWVFGFLLALVTGGSGGGSGGGGGGGGGAPLEVPPVDWSLVLTIAGIVLAVVLFIVVITTIVRYVSETALIAGVDEIESSEAALGVRRGFRLGWSRGALRLFLIDLVIGIPLFLVCAGPLALGAGLIVWVWVGDLPEAIKIVGTLAGVGLACLSFLLVVVSSLLLSLLKPYMRRRAVLGGQGVLASIQQGVGLVRASLLDTGLLWLLLAGIGLVWFWLMVFVGFSVIILAFLVGALLGGLPALLVYAISQSEVAALIVGVPLLSIVLIAAVLFLEALQGVYETYLSGAWTLAYREVSSRAGLAESA